MMTGRRLVTPILALAASLSVFVALSQGQAQKQKQSGTKTPTTDQVPAEYRHGIAQLRSAKAYLEKAGDKWGGYREKAIASIDEVFQALGVSLESTPNEMQSGNVDEPAMINNGITMLQAAKATFAKGSNDWGGRKEKAVALVEQALKDLQTGINWAKEHKTY